MPLPLHVYAVKYLSDIAKVYDLKMDLNAGQKNIEAVFRNSVGETREYSVSLESYDKSDIDDQIETIKKDISEFVHCTEKSWIK